MALGRKVFTRERATVTDIQGVMDQTVMRFPSDSARSVALPVAQRELGMVTFRNELGGVYEAWNGSSWDPIAFVDVPRIGGTFARTDGTSTINGPNAYTGLQAIQGSGTRGTWSAFSNGDGIGFSSAITNSRWLVSALLLTNIGAARIEQLELSGTGATVVGFGSAPGSGFGGAGGAVEVDAPTGLSFSFRYLNSGSVSGNIRGSRWDVQWMGNL